MKLSANQSHYVLQTLMSRGKVRRNQVLAALKGRTKAIAALREQLTLLEGLGGVAGGRRRRRRGRKAKAVGRRRRRAMSPKLRALRRLQGKYMGYVRRLKVVEKARVRAVREKQGMGAAIRLASSLASKSL